MPQTMKMFNLCYTLDNGYTVQEVKPRVSRALRKNALHVKLQISRNIHNFGCETYSLIFSIYTVFINLFSYCAKRFMYLSRLFF